MNLRILIDMETDSFFYQLFQQLPQTLCGRRKVLLGANEK